MNFKVRHQGSGPSVCALLGLGSNLGDRLQHLRRAVFALATHPEITVQGGSRIYQTEFVGTGTQDPYLNACLQISTVLNPRVLLAVLKGVEARHGRLPDGHLKPRPIDLDILFYGDRVVASADLTIPHPLIRERGFVLEPLSELAFSWKFPDSGETIGDACAKIRRKSGGRIQPLDGLRLLPMEPGSGAAPKEDWRAALAVHCR